APIWHQSAGDIVRGAVIDDDQLPIPHGLVANRIDRPRNDMRAIVARHDNTDQWRVCAHEFTPFEPSTCWKARSRANTADLSELVRTPDVVAQKSALVRTTTYTNRRGSSSLPSHSHVSDMLATIKKATKLSGQTESSRRLCRTSQVSRTTTITMASKNS